MKRIVLLILSIIMLLSMAQVVLAENINVTLNGEPLYFDVNPQIINGRTMVPIRAIFEANGANVKWDETTSTVIATRGSKTVQMTIGNPTIYINEISKIMDISPVIVDGRTLVPARFVAEAFDASVEWDGENNNVIITTNQANEQIINPSEEFVISKLRTIPVITGVQAATEEHDPNGKLHKAGGYTAAIYFSTSYINQSDIPGEDIVDKGTDCGGQIEVYKTVEDAEKRNTYLSTFDGTLFDSGLHKVIGTMVIRISSKSTATQQKDLFEMIVNSFMNENTKSVVNLPNSISENADKDINQSGFKKLAEWLVLNGNKNDNDMFSIYGDINSELGSEFGSKFGIKTGAMVCTIQYDQENDLIYIVNSELQDAGIACGLVLSSDKDTVYCSVGFDDAKFSSDIVPQDIFNDTSKINFSNYRDDYTTDLVEGYSKMYTDFVKITILSADWTLKQNNCNVEMTVLGFNSMD